MKRILAFFLVLFLFLSGCGTPASEPSPNETLEIRFLDVGQADAALIRCGGESMLIDGGNREDSSLITSVLKKQNVDNLDYVVCSHAHEDHVGGLPAAFHTASVETVLTPVTDYNSAIFRTFMDTAEDAGCEIKIPCAGDTFSLGSAEITVLGPTRDYDETNDTSIVLKIQHGDVSFLFTGDMERSAEEDLLSHWSEKDLQCTVLKVGHHGSETSSSYPFLRAVDPEYGIISVGNDNSYGHPHDEVLSRFRDADISLYRTDLQGDIIAVSNGTTVTITTARKTTVSTNPTAVTSVDSYIGNKKSKTFHLPSCASLPAEQNQIDFKTRDDALDAGYSPCKNCHA